MEYHGKLYGKLGGMYFDTTKTSDDFDALQNMARWFIQNHYSLVIDADISDEDKVRVLRMLNCSAVML